MADDDDDEVEDDEDEIVYDEKKNLCGISMPEIKFCCYCIPLKIGCVIIAIILIIIGIGELFLYNEPDLMYDRSADEDDESIAGRYQKRMADSQMLRHLGLGSACVGLGVLLLYGTLAEALWALVLWLWLFTSMLIAVSVAAIPFAVRQGGKEVMGAVLETVLTLALILLGIYILLVVYSFYAIVRFVEDTTHSQINDLIHTFGDQE